LRDQSTAHVHRVDVAARRTGNWLDFAVALAPAGFERVCDGVCIHRAGTVLYVGPAVPALLELEGRGSIVGSSLMDLFQPADRSSIASLLSGEDFGGHAPSTQVSLLTGHGKRIQVELTARRASDASPPVDVLYLRARGHSAASFGENEPLMASRQMEGTLKEPGRPTVLICDDEARLGALTAGLLSEFGFVPVTVGTGEDALRAIADESPAIDVLLLDVNLSVGRSAKDVLASMTAHGAESRVILTSGLAEEDVDEELLNHPSVVGYVAKPYGVDQLIQSINKALGRPSTHS
jgi:CheY-like chemotaxis protein